jgi:hypothetical protein
MIDLATDSFARFLLMGKLRDLLTQGFDVTKSRLKYAT